MTAGLDVTDPVDRAVLWILWVTYGTLVIRGDGETPAAHRVADAIGRELRARRARIGA